MQIIYILQSHFKLASSSSRGLTTWAHNKRRSLEIIQKNDNYVSVSGILAHGHKLPLIFLEDVQIRANGEPFVDDDGIRMQNISVTTEVHIEFTLERALTYFKENNLWRNLGEGRGELGKNNALKKIIFALRG